MISAREALDLLREGNRRFVAERQRDARVGATRRNELTERQEPFAIVLGCSDSRVPAEIVFDQGLGDLFVIRVAGNIVAPSQIGSVEFAAEQFHTRLVVVLGHSGCGAVLATIDQLKRPVDKQSRNLRAIVDRVRPSVEPLLAAAPPGDPQALVRHAVRANVRASVSNLRHGSEILEQLIERDGLLVVGAEYSLETGVVEFFEGLAADSRDVADPAEGATAERGVDEPRRLSPGLAFLGGLVGLGYLYVGRLGLAIAFTLAPQLFLLAAGWTRLLVDPIGWYVSVAAPVVLWLVQLVHPVTLAWSRPLAPAKPYNRWWCYVAWLAGVAILQSMALPERGTAFGYELFRNPAGSMSPTLEPGDVVVVDTWHYRDASPEFGDLVVYRLDRHHLRQTPRRSPPRHGRSPRTATRAQRHSRRRAIPAPSRAGLQAAGFPAARAR